MKILVTGAAGQLGTDLMSELAGRGIHAVGCDLQGTGCVPLDITDRQAARRVVAEAQADVVLHCAAWTAVDAAEEPGKRERVYAVNAAGTANIVRACEEAGSRLIYLSTDYVFSGQGDRPWEPDDPREPLNWYGATKAMGEEAVEQGRVPWAIVRTAWVFGLHGKNFVRTMLRLGKTAERLTVVDDQIGTPTYTPDLARLLADMAVGGAEGRFHATNEGGYISWFAFAEEIFRQASAYDPACGRVRVEPVSSAEYRSARAVRPANSRLNRSRIPERGYRPLPTWQDALSRFLADHFARQEQD